MRFCTPALAAAILFGPCTENLWSQTTADGGHRSAGTVRRAAMNNYYVLIEKGGAARGCISACESTGFDSSCGHCRGAWGHRTCGSCYPDSTILSELIYGIRTDAVWRLLSELFVCHRCHDACADPCAGSCGTSCSGALAEVAPIELQPPPVPLDEEQSDPFEDDPIPEREISGRLPGPAGMFVKRATPPESFRATEPRRPVLQERESVARDEPAEPLLLNLLPIGNR